MNRLFQVVSDMPFALAASRAQLLLLGGLVAWPMVSNIEISFFTSAAQSQHRVNLCWGE